MIDKFEILEMYSKGMTCKEIAIEVGAKEDTIKRRLKRNFPEEVEAIKNLRKKQNQIKRKEKKKEVKQEQQRKTREKRETEEPDFMRTWSNNNPVECRMSDASFICWNRQAYKTDKKGNLVFDQQRNGDRVSDTPRTYKPIII